jgi:hypothetical protein
MSDNEKALGPLWDQLNSPSRFGTPQSTIDAIMYCVRERGLALLKEPANVERLLRCDANAKAQIDQRIETLRQKGLLK